MNKEKIFRAWILEHNKMVDVMALHRNQTIYVSHQQLFGSPGDDILLKPEEYDLMEQTGDLDANLKETYEGDIIRVTFSDGSGLFIGVIYYGLCWYGECPASECYMVRRINGAPFSNLPLADLCHLGKAQLEILGNKYENPELLTKNNE